MVFITGGSGLVGTRLIYELDQKGEQIIALNRSEKSVDKFKEQVKFYTNDILGLVNRINWVEGDVLDYESLLNQLPEKAEVYHCAAFVSFNPADGDKIREVNVDGTANIINACLQKNVKKLCHVSSIAAIGGKIKGHIIDEDTPWSASGKSAYALSKYHSELEIWRGVAEGLNAVIVNPAVILGPGIWSEGSPSFFAAIHRGLPFYTLGTTSYVDVGDVTKAMIFFMAQSETNDRFLLASETWSFQQFFNQIAKELGVRPPKIYANRLLTGIVYRMLTFTSLFTRKTPFITKQTHQSSHELNSYSGAKITEKTGFTYTPINETIKFICECYLSDK